MAQPILSDGAPLAASLPISYARAEETVTGGDGGGYP